jgi:hypothetical protein
MPTRKIVYDDLPGIPRVYVIYDDEKHIPVGRALVIFSNTDCILWDIYIEPHYRNRYYASDIISAIKQDFQQIQTDSISIEGKKLCLKSGFVEKNTNNLKLVWKKEEENASKNH